VQPSFFRSPTGCHLLLLLNPDEGGFGGHLAQQAGHQFKAIVPDGFVQGQINDRGNAMGKKPEIIDIK
jgi:hypothetical protein